MTDAQITFSSFSVSLCVSFYLPYCFPPFYSQTECVSSQDFLSGSPSKTQPPPSPTSTKVKITLLHCQAKGEGRKDGPLQIDG